MSAAKETIKVFIFLPSHSFFSFALVQLKVFAMHSGAIRQVLFPKHVRAMSDNILCNSAQKLCVYT